MKRVYGIIEVLQRFVPENAKLLIETTKNKKLLLWHLELVFCKTIPLLDFFL